MAADPVTAVSTLLSQVFGFAVEANGYEKLSREHKLKLWERGFNEALDRGDWPVCDDILQRMRDLRRQTGP